MDQSSNKFVAFLAILATPLAAGAFLLSWAPSNHFNNSSPSNDGFVAPRDIGSLIDDIQASTVSVMCRVGKDGYSLGTGWAIDPSLLTVKSNKTTIMTNHHVIDTCIDDKGVVTVAKLSGKEQPAEILTYDKKNDLAVLETKIKLAPLDLSENAPWPGYWVMALGSAAAYEGSVAFGSVLNVTNEDVLITNNISEGNSGGPLVDNEGKVIGIVTWGMDYRKEQFNGARSLDVFCIKLLKCEYAYKGDKTWWEYNE